MARTMPALTGIRGIAALWVIFYHYGITPLDALRFDQVLPFARYGYIGVDLFFILSGFIITHVHGRDAASLAPRPVLHFLSLRIARIYPVHIITLCALVPVVVLGTLVGSAAHHPEDFRAKDFLFNVLLVQSWGVADDIHWNFPSWSVSCEWLAYLLFPVFALLLARIASARQAVLWLSLETAAFAIAYVFYFDCGLDLRFDVGGFAHLALARIGFEFAAGALLYKLLELADLRRWPWSVLLGVALALAVALAGTAAHDLVLVACAALTILAAAFSDTLVARLLRVAPIVWLGDISYSLYMVHAPVRMTLGRVAGMAIARASSPVLAWSVAALLLAATIVAGAVLHALVEVPARRWLLRWIADPLAGTERRRRAVSITP
jgi:peptidoglycan/LPS O-acetylase OafA/YrhL